MTEDLILRAFKTELDPNQAEAFLLTKHVDAARVSHNWALNLWNVLAAARGVARCARWLAFQPVMGGEAAGWLGFVMRALVFGRRVKAVTKKGTPQRYRYQLGDNIPDVTPSGPMIHAALVRAKALDPGLEWLSEVSSAAVREAVGDVADGYDLFYKHLKAGRYERAGVPRFRPWRARHYHDDQPNPIRVEKTRIKIPGVGWVRLKEHGYIPETREKSHEFLYGGRVCGIGVTEKAGRWYVALRCWVPRPRAQARAPGRALRALPVPRKPDLVVGVDSGLREAVVTSTGLRLPGLEQDRRLRSLERRLKLWERKKARRQKAKTPERLQSQGWKEAVRQIQKYYRKVSDIRDDRVGKMVRQIVDTGAARVVVRGPQVHGMLSRNVAPDAGARNALAPRVHVSRMGDLSRRLQYKQTWARGECVEADVAFESTKTCSACGVVRDTDPGYAGWTCAACGAVHEREANAAENLKNYRPSPEAPRGSRPERPGETPAPAGETVARTASPADGSDNRGKPRSARAVKTSRARGQPSGQNPNPAPLPGHELGEALSPEHGAQAEGSPLGDAAE